MEEKDSITLYHGSNIKITNGVVEPNISFHLIPYVYATSDPLYALVRSGRFNPETPLVREEYSGFGDYELAELEPYAFHKLFDCPGYIYELDTSTFQPLEDGMLNEFVSSQPAKIKTIYTIENIWRQINAEKQHFKLYRYGEKDWGTVSGGLEGYLLRRRRSIDQLHQARDSIRHTESDL